MICIAYQTITPWYKKKICDYSKDATIQHYYPKEMSFFLKILDVPEGRCILMNDNTNSNPSPSSLKDDDILFVNTKFRFNRSTGCI